MTLRDIENNFTYHSPTTTQVDLYRALRDKGRELAELIYDLCPTSRERSVAFTKVEESVMWANASIARDPNE